MAIVYLIAGLGLGDEGKGSVTDHLTRLYGAHTVVRYNGGAQCAHNVVTEDGRHHTFHQFGSGTFAGARTHLSRHMLLNPVTMLSEGFQLHRAGLRSPHSLVTVERGALVTNPFQIVTNRLREIARSGGRHGSCGLGIGETMADHEDYGLSLFAGDLDNPDVARAKLIRSQEHKREQMAELVASIPHVPGDKGEPSDVEHNWEVLTDPTMVDWCLTRFTEFARRVQLVDEDYLQGILDGPGTVLFEGAQGVLLDQAVGFFPYVTRSDITYGNALDLLQGRPATRLGLVRTYATRHGAGPFVTEDTTLTYPEKHNGYGPWQQGWRRGHFDLVATRYAIEAIGGVDGIVVTHLDYLPGPQKVCTAYSPEVDLSVPTSIPEQERITEALLRTEPRYETMELLPELAKLAPIAHMSYGPTAEDKVTHGRHQRRETPPRHRAEPRGGRAPGRGRSVRPLPLHV